MQIAANFMYSVELALRVIGILLTSTLQAYRCFSALLLDVSEEILGEAVPRD